MISNFNGYQAYQKNKYETASPHRLITMLYDGVIRFANQAISQIESNNIEGTNQAVKRMQDIVYELIACLNFNEGKDIAVQLNSLYMYVIDLSIRSNIEKNVEPLQQAIAIIIDIKASWEQIGKEVTMNNG
ncbi:flagellar export chaperone FliS [Paenibacillus endoradicis]|uniref:flagellar export chaperone FliS n=1 Tax=Paenibacillus endoradicis TaxID=2972487 RepID=UPI0021591C95|nr:flagellar export chaperone FliS [Paenibacillus endoradicis]MCR8660508.1 flagellar export chaperone FliS [Paenibacillus endoradicis]